MIMTFICSPSCGWGKSNSYLDSLDFKNLNFHEVQKTRKSIIKFYKDTEKAIPADKEKFVFLDILDNKLHAADGDTCFFGGWESREMSGKCKAPWKYGSDYTPCGDGMFRCNPLLFGKGQDGHGSCLKTEGSYQNLTSKCDNQTQSDLNSTLQHFSQNPKKLQEIVISIKNYCSNKKDTEACKGLESRLSKIKKRSEEIRSIEANRIVQNNVNSNKAHGILKACQKHYESENEGFWSSMVKSERNIINGISNNFSLCKRNRNNIISTSFEEIEESLE